MKSEGKNTRALPRGGLVALLFSTVVLIPAPALGQSCGDILRADTVLTSDIGPCPGSGLVVLNDVTLDLNGFTIRGSGGGAGVTVSTFTVAVKGPGTITNFGVGITNRLVRTQETPGSGTTTVEDLNLVSNRVGISFVQFTRTNGLRIIDNTIEGKLVGETGIHISEMTGPKIKGNTITGHTQRQGTGIFVLNVTGAIVTQNSVTGNIVGLQFDNNRFSDFRSDPIKISCNTFSDNMLDGITTSGGSITMENNSAIHNGRDGISIAGPSTRQATNLIQDNLADNNGHRGIALLSAQNTSTQIIDNEALGNTVDLFWDSTGDNNCWKLNTFDTGDPATLPACP